MLYGSTNRELKGIIMSFRRNWIKVTMALLAGAGATQIIPSASGQQNSGNNFANSIDDIHLSRLEDQLRFGLRATQQSQFDYISTVVASVESGQTPRAMVNIVYRWAVKRNPIVPLPYFQFAMRELSRRRGVTLP
jgi:hypothetical protein